MPFVVGHISTAARQAPINSARRELLDLRARQRTVALAAEMLGTPLTVERPFVGVNLGPSRLHAIVLRAGGWI